VAINKLKAVDNHQPKVADRSAAGGRPGVTEGLDATSAAVRSARGVVLKQGLGAMSDRHQARVMNGADGLAQSIDAAALEVKGLLGRMRHLASKSTGIDVTRDERRVIQDEFSMLQAQLDRIESYVGVEQQVGTAGGVEGEGSLQPGREFTDRLTAEALEVGSRFASVEKADDAEWALVRIDAAEQAVQQLRDEFGTVEERIDAALDRLAEFVESFSPAQMRQGSPSDVLAAAERVRMKIMQNSGISTLGQARGLPKGVSSLLQ